MTDIMAALVEADMNDIGMSILGSKVAVAGMLDRKGLLKLEKKIAGLKALLDTDDDETAPDETEH